MKFFIVLSSFFLVTEAIAFETQQDNLPGCEKAPLCPPKPIDCPKPPPPPSCHCKIPGCILGRAGYSSAFPPIFTPPGYNIVAPVYPNSNPLSMNRNIGKAKGIKLTDTGLKIKSAGSYSVSFSVVLINEDQSGQTNPTFFETFVILDGNNDLTDPNNVVAFGGAVIPIDQVAVMEGSGIIIDAPAGTTVSIFVNNIGQVPVTCRVESWFIVLTKIPCSK